MSARRRRGIAVAVVLLSAQLGALAHSLEHHPDRPTAPVCLSCAAVEVSANSVHPPGVHAPLMVRRGLRTLAPALPALERRNCTAQPRAPPFSN